MTSIGRRNTSWIEGKEPKKIVSQSAKRENETRSKMTTCGLGMNLVAFASDPITQ